MFKRVLLSVWTLLLGCAVGNAQTTIIGPSVNNGGFEDATNTAWTILNGSQTNKWQISTGATAGFLGTKSAYISSSATAPFAHTYTNSTSSVLLYQDVTLPASEPVITFSFRYIGVGEQNIFGSYDRLLVFISSGTPGAAPAAGVTIANGYTPTITGYDLLQVVPSSATWTTVNIPITAAQAGNSSTSTSRRILFVWKNDASVLNNPPAGIDDVLLTSRCPAPTGLTANSITVTSATLTWTALTGATGYNVRYKKVSDPVTVATWATPTNTTATTINITGLTPNETQYEFQVSATGPTCNVYSFSDTFKTLCTTYTLPYTETFEGITAANQLPACMAADNLGSTFLTNVTNASDNRINHTPGGSKSASFQYNSSNWLFTPGFNFVAGTAYKISFWYVADGANGWDSLKLGIGGAQNAAGMSLQFGVDSINIKNRFYKLYSLTYIPTTSGINYVGIHAVSSSTIPWYLTVDDINIQEVVACSGTPATEVIASSTNSSCPTDSFVLTTNNGANVAQSGIVYQWQSAPTSVGPWANVMGAPNNYTYTQNGVSVPTYFRLRVTCTASSLVSISNAVLVNPKNIQTCYCTSQANSAQGSDIGQVTVGTYANPTAAPTPLINNTTATRTYTNFTTSVATIPLVKGAATPITVTQINRAGFDTCLLRVYIDYNQNGSFNDAGELVFSPASSVAASSPTFSGSFTVPTSALSGVTRMRFLLVRDSMSPSGNPCGSYERGETEDYSVNIPGVPNPPILTNNGAICSKDSAEITATANVPNPVFTVTGPGIVTPITNSTGTIKVPLPANATFASYNVTVTAYGETSAPASIVLYIIPSLALGTQTNPSGCLVSDGSVQITGVAPNSTYTLRYRKNAVNVTPFTINTDATGNYNIVGLGVGTFDSIRLVTTSGCVSNAVGPVTLVPPVAPAAPVVTYNSPLCPGATLTLTVSNPLTNAIYSWTGPNGFVDTGAIITKSNVVYADSGSYSVIVTVVGCPSTPTVTKVVVTPPSPQPTTANISLCQNSLTGPLTAVGTNLLFYRSLTTGTGFASLTPTTTTVGDSTFYVTQNTTGCESVPRKALKVTIKLTPGIPTIPNGGTINQCQFSTPTPLTITGLAGATFTYYSTATGTTIIPVPVPQTTTPGVVNYYVSQTLNGCEGPRTIYTVVTIPKPAPPTVTSPFNVCQFAVVGPLAAGGQDINWYESASGGVQLLTPPVPQTNIGTPTAGNPVRDTFFATQTVNGCESDRALVEVVVNYQPNATFIPSKRFVCADDTISFVYYGNADANATYTWSIPRPSGTEISGQGTQGPFIARFDTVGTVTVNLIVSANGCTSTPVYQSFEVRDRPQTRINAKREICIDEVVEISLDSISQQITNYNFTFDGGKVEYATYDAGPFGVSWNTPGQKRVIVNSTSRLCGSRVQAEIINVRPAPPAFIQNKPTGQVCSGDSVRLQANDIGPGYTYTWTPANIFQDRSNRGLTVFTTPIFRQGKYAAELTVTDTAGCEGKDYLEINTIPCCDVYFPNAFAPNSQNEVNARFKMISQGVPTRYTLRVVNRWGRVMFETSDARQGWDGRYDGEAQPTGTYFYYAKYRCSNGEDFEQKGEVTLIR